MVDYETLYYFFKILLKATQYCDFCFSVKYTRTPKASFIILGESIKEAQFNAVNS